MISVFSYNRIIKEQQIIEKGCRHEVAKRTDDKLMFTKALSSDDLPGEDAGDSLTDIIYYEVKNQLDVDSLKQLRRREAGAMLMLMAPPALSPTKYLRPGIAPDSLLLKPFVQADFDEVNQELFDAFLAGMEVTDKEENFILNFREGRTVFPFHKISFFEASNKKINVRVGNEEYDFYGSIEHLLHIVPNYFIRSHRAYVVNTKKIRNLKLSEGLIQMEGGAVIPLSRTYKQNFKKMMMR